MFVTLCVSFVTRKLKRAENKDKEDTKDYKSKHRDRSEKVRRRRKESDSDEEEDVKKITKKRKKRKRHTDSNYSSSDDEQMEKNVPEKNKYVKRDRKTDKRH